jgi:hypothetical protein
MLAVAALGAASISTAGCGGGGGSGGNGGDGGSGANGGSGAGASAACFDYAKIDLTSPAVSFKTDVLPIFQRSCGLTTGCHGDPLSPNENRPYLGPKKSVTATADDIMKIRADIIDQPSYFEISMDIVEPGDPEHSFLMHKLDFTLKCDEVLDCVSKKECGVAMPQGNDEPLALDERNLVRRWIAQGALDN